MKRKQISHRQRVATVERQSPKPARRRPSRAELQLRSILEATTIFYGAWNVSAGQICLSDRLLAALGYSNVDSSGRPELFKSLIHPDDRADFESRLQAHLAGNNPNLDCDLRLRTPGGSYRWFRLLGKVMQRPRSGAPIQVRGVILDVHERMQHQEEMAKSHRQLSAIFEVAEDCISIVDPSEFRLVAFNKAFDDLIFKANGVRVREGMRAEDVNPQRAERWKEFYRQVLAVGKISFDYEIPSLNTTHHVFAQRIVRDGRVWGICIMGHDVTSRKQTEEALRKSEEKFAKAFRDAPLALSLRSTRDHRYIDVNDAYLEATGYNREDLVGKTPREIDVWVHPEKRMELVEEVLLTGEVRNVEVLFRNKAGEIREATGSAALIEIDGEPCMLSVLMDITERKRAAEALSDSEERFRVAIEAGRMYAFEWDAATDLVERSKFGPQLLNLPNDGSTHTKQELIERMHPEDRLSYRRALEALTPESPNYRAIFRLPLHDGRTAWLEESGKAIFGPDGKLRKVIGITSDVTEVRQSERALRELSGRLISSQEEERRRIARELHDHIGQEAALICVQAQRIDSGVADAENTTHSDVHELYRRIKVLSSDISKLSHRLHSSELSFIGLAVAAERLCRDFASQYGIDVDYQVRSLPPLDSAKSLCFYRVLQEGLQNVAKHSHATQVVVQLQAVRDELKLEVRDNGDGFDVDQTGFESGLGLLSMRERLNLVGGQFAISSRRGSGTKLTANVTV